MKKCKDIVYSLLENNPSLRDCDVKLMCAVWKKQSGLGYYFSEKPISFLFDLMLEKKLSSAESIRRSRAKLCSLFRGRTPQIPFLNSPLILFKGFWYESNRARAVFFSLASDTNITN